MRTRERGSAFLAGPRGDTRAMPAATESDPSDDATPATERERGFGGAAPGGRGRDALLGPGEFVADPAGDVPPDASDIPAAWQGGRYAGAWFRDARVLSRYELRCNGRPLRLLEMQQLGSRGARYRLAIPGCDELVVFRHQLLD